MAGHRGAGGWLIMLVVLVFHLLVGLNIVACLVIDLQYGSSL